MQAPLDAALAHHRAGRLDEAAVLYLQSIEAQPDCAVALNMLGNIEYQRNRVDDALRLIGRAIDIDPASPAYRITLGHVYRRTGDMAMAGSCYREALRLSPGSTLAAVSLADALKGQGELAGAVELLQGVLAREPDRGDALGLLGDLWLELERPADAVRVFSHLLAVDARSADAAFRLGVAANQQGEASLAIASFELAISLRPDFPEAHYNLGVIAAQRQDLVAAEAWFRRTLAIRPDDVDAHVNLSALLLRTGRADEARLHRDNAYRRQCVFLRPSRTARRTVLILFDAGKGNINLSHLFPRTHNNVVDWMIEYAPDGQGEALPGFDLVFNAMGDPDIAGTAVAAATHFIAACNRPVLNRPEAVARTARDKLPALLASIDGLRVPEVWRVAADEPWPATVAGHLPLLVRPVDTHGGGGLQRLQCSSDLERAAATRTGAVYVSTFRDFRSADGWYRKYRVIFIDKDPYPYHLAISPHWLVHYATAGMQADPWKLEEERRFLEDPQQALGAAGMAAIAAIGSRMDLDYSGVDFSVLADGRILVFEANPVMLVHPEDEQGVLAFKNPFVARILDAFEALLSRRTASGQAR
jgi:tetratricopeptide (TPR) repeat protein